jgi:hypothetical protein
MHKNEMDLTQSSVSGKEPYRVIDGLPSNQNSPTHFVDIINLIFRNDGFGILGFFSRALGVNVEECRVCMSHASLKNLVNLLCKAMNYYPTRQDSQNVNNKTNTE